MRIKFSNFAVEKNNKMIPCTVNQDLQDLMALQARIERTTPRLFGEHYQNSNVRRKRNVQRKRRMLR